MKILESEMELREDTRVANQAKEGISEDDYKQEAHHLSERQGELRQRTEDLTERIRSLPQANEFFGKEIQLLTAVELVMRQAAQILDQPDTGFDAIAAETEAIELMLMSKRINPKGGGGGGTSPGGGGGGTTTDSALALLGKGINQKEVRRQQVVSQATGDTKSQLPEEYRTGLDRYYNEISK